jgi:hypothetical protein
MGILTFDSGIKKAHNENGKSPAISAHIKLTVEA